MRNTEKTIGSAGGGGLKVFINRLAGVYPSYLVIHIQTASRNTPREDLALNLARNPRQFAG